MATWLLERSEGARKSTEHAGRVRLMAELAARAAGSDISFQNSSHLLRILEGAVRDASLEAGAVIDLDGRIVAHTDLSRIGTRTSIDPAVFPDARPDPAMAALFSGDGLQLIRHPLLGGDGPVGVVVFAAVPPGGAAASWSSLKALIPAALLILAFVGIVQASIRRAMQPTSESLERLRGAVERAAGSESPADGSTSDLAPVIERTVDAMSGLRRERENLAIENQAIDFDRKRLELILNSLPEGLLMTDWQGEVHFANRMAAKMLNLEIGDDTGRRLHRLSDEVRQFLGEADMKPRELPGDSLATGGHKVLVLRVPLSSPSRRASGTLHVLRDMSAQAAAERAQAEFLSQISHELKAPLNTILGYVEALTEEGLLTQAERREYANTLQTEAQRMGRLISNLLRLSRIELGSLSGSFRYVKAPNVIRSIAESVRAQAEAASLDYQVQVPENLPSIFGDKDLFGVAITNLVTNAIKYTPASGRVLVRAREEEGGIVVEIQDTGIGIPEDSLSRIFERFVRTEQEEVRNLSGSGLGLALVKEIAELHDGRVFVESVLGEGSTFQLWLPTREADTELDVPAA